MCVNKDIVGTDSFINLGVSGSDIYDILAQFGLMDIYGKKTKRVIFCVDSYSFDESFYAADGAQNAIDVYKRQVVLLGDRYETLAIAIAAGNTHTPIFHLCGGDTTEGAIEDVYKRQV